MRIKRYNSKVHPLFLEREHATLRVTLFLDNYFPQH